MTELEKLILKKNRIKQMEDQKRRMDAKIEAESAINQAEYLELTARKPRQVWDQAPPTASTVDLSGSKNMNKSDHPMSYLLRQKQMLQNTYQKLSQAMDKEAALLKQQTYRESGNIVPGGAPQTLKHNFEAGLVPSLLPGNLGDINKVIWPFWFTTTKTTLAPNTAAQGNITITQEAAFIWLAYSKTVLLEETGSPGQYQYVDPDEAGAAAKSNNLTFLIRDSQSSRQFMNKAIDINQVGHWKYPTVLPTPQLLLPNSNIEVTYQNNDNDVTYRPFITFFGLRVRIEDAKNILSTISA